MTENFLTRSSRGNKFTRSARAYLFVVARLILPLSHLAEAQQTGKIFRIGFLNNSTPASIAVPLEGFREELSKLGWIEGKNISIEYRFAEQKNERLPGLAAELVRLVLSCAFEECVFCSLPSK